MKNRFFYYSVFFLIGLIILINRDITPGNELKYISIALESLQHHHWFTFYNHGEIYADKPPAYFWIIMLGIKLFGVEGGIIWTGLFSLLPAIAICEIMYRWTKNSLDTPLQTLAILTLLSSGLFLGCTVILRMDMLMALFITLALYCFYQTYLRHRHGQALSNYPYWMLFAILAATFVKGPVGLMLPIISSLVFLTYKKSLRDVKYYFPLKAVLLCIATLALWLFAIYLEGGKDYLYALTLGQAAKRGISASIHPEPIYYYLENAPLLLLPWSLVLLCSFINMFRAKRPLRDEQRFFITVAFVGLTMLSLVSSKLEIYLLPLIPFIIYAGLLQLPQLEKGRVWKWGIAPIIVICCVLPIAAFFIPQLTRKLPVEPFDLHTLLVVLLITGGISAYYLFKNQMVATLKTIALGCFGVMLSAAILLPKYNQILGVKKVAQTALQLSTPQSQFYSYHYTTGLNLDVYLNHPVKLLKSDQQLIELPQGSVILTKRDEKAIKQALQAANRTFQSEISIGKHTLFVL
ncbi:ArnT family glycosyltransferase [Vibrio rumoiensis]|uniref:ArnT family glycosyltransferase n=1 Tax=Vibrio rumoiensis TaxID=76258 RepID=A0ABW7IX98_9VIBR